MTKTMITPSAVKVRLREERVAEFEALGYTVVEEAAPKARRRTAASSDSE